MTIHNEHPFAPGPEERDRPRRFRGRLAAGVTIVTSGGPDDRTGLTVSSLLLIEGDPATIQLVVGPTAELWDVVARTGRFVVHVCHGGQHALADTFAGLRPSPGGVFATVDVEDTEWGPVIHGIEDLAYCSVVDRAEVGYSGLLTGSVDEVTLSDLADPLVYFRGSYRRLG